MKIGIDARYAFRPQRRGIGEYVWHLLATLADMAPETMRFQLYVDAKARLDALELPKERFRLRVLPVTNPLAFEEVFLPRAARQDRVQLLHLTANYGPSLAPCRTVYTVHDVIEFRRQEAGAWQQDLRHGLGRLWRTRALPWQARRAQMVICPSQATRRDVVAVLRVAEERVRVIPHGVAGIAPHPDPASLRRELRRRGYPVPERYLLAFAALDPRKNGAVLAASWHSLAPLLPEAELWLVGVEDVRAYPVPRGLERVRVLPFLPRADVVDLLRAASAFVYPSRYEGFGFPVLEAMAAGVPVVAAQSSSLPEVAGEAALLFPPDDHDLLTRHLLAVLTEDAQRRALVERGLARAAQFTWQRSCAAHLEVYA